MREIKCDKCNVKKCDTRDAIEKHPEMRIIIGHIIEGCNEYEAKHVNGREPSNKSFIWNKSHWYCYSCNRYDFGKGCKSKDLDGKTPLIEVDDFGGLFCNQYNKSPHWQKGYYYAEKELITKFLDEYDIFYDTLLRIKESRESKRTRGVIPEVACILEEEIHSYSKEGYRRDKWEAKRRE